jgi:hypothetical protein
VLAYERGRKADRKDHEDWMHAARISARMEAS